MLLRRWWPTLSSTARDGIGGSGDDAGGAHRFARSAPVAAASGSAASDLQRLVGASAFEPLHARLHMCTPIHPPSTSNRSGHQPAMAGFQPEVPELVGELQHEMALS